jgi:hypothetical protein
VLLSYPVLSEKGELVYGKGGKDLMFCAFYTAFFTFVREWSMEMVLAPLAKWAGLQKSKQGRFMEQCYSCVHYTIFGVYGIVGPWSLVHLPSFLRVVPDVTNTDMAVTNGTLLFGVSA